MLVKVTRSGGFAGLQVGGELDTAGQPDREQLDAAIGRLDQKRLGSGVPQPDRYVYRVELRAADEADPVRFTVAEQDLDETTAWLLDRVLSQD
ncbi:hypothetical protein EV643_113172 [Kribbella sp. VKM Ac-2527]|uniref:Uncharacterized protein n=1 Tax=Kribbella caucasensis TaxID=2512215 RepID=A0A4R6K975_9ACTN|nr:protealysin inhibitor emfourin [Kribbella sp. VKM Ac-2527]TDO45399.1 hypothetical protein EV643_113172 [Kribbella sp. VKM Ac-2527]